MALHQSSCHFDDFCVQLLPPPPPPLPDWDWDWEWELRCTLGDDAAAAAREREGSIHDAFTALPSLGLESPVSSSSSEASSGSDCGGGGGYLEDAVAHWSGRCKRQRTAAADEEELPPRCAAMASEDLQSVLQSFWDATNGEGDFLHDLNAMAPDSTASFGSEQGAASGREKGEQAEGAPTRSAAAAGQGEGGEADEEAAGPPPPPFSATGQRAPSPGSWPLQKATAGPGSNYCEPEPASSTSSSLAVAGKSGGGRGVVYPFAVVKPLGLGDGGTLSDVNRRILKRPARPVRHPVGQFACGPVVSSPHGLGLSGKAVVSLTKIRTGGKGTITIIRTRG